MRLRLCLSQLSGWREIYNSVFPPSPALFTGVQRWAGGPDSGPADEGQQPLWSSGSQANCWPGHGQHRGRSWPFDFTHQWVAVFAKESVLVPVSPVESKHATCVRACSAPWLTSLLEGKFSDSCDARQPWNCRRGTKLLTISFIVCVSHDHSW